MFANPTKFQNIYAIKYTYLSYISRQKNTAFRSFPKVNLTDSNKNAHYNFAAAARRLLFSKPSLEKYTEVKYAAENLRITWAVVNKDDYRSRRKQLVSIQFKSSSTINCVLMTRNDFEFRPR